jgi:hypothetical protein
MRRNPFTLAEREMRRIVRQEGQTPADQGRGNYDRGGVVNAGKVDASGEIVLYGRLGITPLGTGDGFLLGG